MKSTPNIQIVCDEIISMMRKIILLVLFLLGFCSYGQMEERPSVNRSQSQKRFATIIGYKRTNINNMIFGGSYHVYNSGCIGITGYSIEAKYITNFSDNHIGVLGAHMMFNGLNAGLNVSNKYVEPILGIDFMLGKITAGYAMTYINKNYFTLGIYATIPIVKHY